MAFARPCNGARIATRAFRERTHKALYLPIILDPEYHYEAVNVEAQLSNPHSLIWWMKRLLGLRKRWKALGQGSLKFLQPDNRKILAYIRCFEDQCILVVVNLSRFVQPVALDLTSYGGHELVELFGRTQFPPITDDPYFLTMGPHSFYWFSIQPRFAKTTSTTLSPARLDELAPLRVGTDWTSVLQEDGLRTQLENMLQPYVKERRWFGSKTREIQNLTIEDAVKVGSGEGTAYFLLLRLDFLQTEGASYLLPIAALSEEASHALLQRSPQLLIARLELR